MRHGSVVCTVTVYMPSGVPPLHTFRFPLLSSSMTKNPFRHRLLLQCELKLHFLICKALAVPNMKKV